MAASLNLIKEKDQPWYRDGLKFECTQCGQCCTGAPGYIWVTEDEIKEMADYLKISVEDFRKKYVRTVGKKESLLEDPKTYDCVFLKDKKCQLYSTRPKQCRTFPWWPQHLKSEKDWQEAAKYCEGINSNAPTVPYSTIHTQLVLQESTKPS